MGDIHDLVLKHGRQGAMQLVPDEDRRLVDIAAKVLEEENSALGITYSGFCLTALPHRRLPDEQHWERRGQRITLVVEPGRLPDGKGSTKLYGVPYGSRARLILLYLQTQAIRSKSPEVELGRSMKAWMERMGASIGGKAYQDIREQANRISACHLTFMWDGERKSAFSKDSIVKDGIQLWDGLDDRQQRLWVETVKLSDSFFKALKEHPVPIWEPAIKAIATQSMAIDIYVWLSYRLHVLGRATPITWAAVHGQFGAGYRAVRQFKPRFIECLKTALAVYPDARVDVTDAGLVLHPSAPPVPERELALLR